MEFICKVWIQNVGDIDFEMIYGAKNANKFQKTRFWKEKSVEDVVTLGPMAHATLVFIIKKYTKFQTAFKPLFVKKTFHEKKCFDKLQL